MRPKPGVIIACCCFRCGDAWCAVICAAVQGCLEWGGLTPLSPQTACTTVSPGFRSRSFIFFNPSHITAQISSSILHRAHRLHLYIDFHSIPLYNSFALYHFPTRRWAVRKFGAPARASRATPLTLSRLTQAFYRIWRDPNEQARAKPEPTTQPRTITRRPAVRDSHRRNAALRVDNARLQETIRNLRSRRDNLLDESTPVTDPPQSAEHHNDAVDNGTSLANVSTPTLPPMESTDLLVDVEPDLDEDFPHLRRMPGRLFRARTLRSPPPPVVDASSDSTATLFQNMLNQDTSTSSRLRINYSDELATPNPLRPSHADESTDLALVRDWTMEQGFPSEVAADTTRIYQSISRLWLNANRARGRIAVEQTRLSTRTETLRVAQDKISDIQERFTVFVESMQTHAGASTGDAAFGETLLPTLRTMTHDLEGIEPSVRNVLGSFGLTLDAEADRRRFIVEPPYNLGPDHALNAARRQPEDVLATSRATARAQEEEDEEGEGEEEEQEEEQDDEQSHIGRWRASLTTSNLPSTTDFVDVISPHIRRVTSAVARSTTQHGSRRLESLNRLARAHTSLEDKLNNHQDEWAMLRPSHMTRFLEAQVAIKRHREQWAKLAILVRKLYVEFEDQEDDVVEAQRCAYIGRDQGDLGAELETMIMQRRTLEGVLPVEA